MMIDLKLLKENPQIIEDMLKKRKLDFPVKDLLTLDKMRRRIVIEMQETKHKKNILANTIATKKKNKEDIAGELEEMNKIGDKIMNLEREKAVIEPKFRHLVMMIPNIIHESVPIGTDETDNVIIKQNVSTRKYSFNPKDHVDIATSLDLVDIERAAKISGARFYFLKNDLVRMNQALIQFSLDFLFKKGYVLVQPPFMIRQHAMEGAVILEDFQEVIYKIEDEDLYMIGTSEHALAAMHMHEILEGKNLPIRYGGISPCFRKEAGAHGKDMKGIFRVHQFEKVEQFIYSRPEDSWKEHERMLSLTEEFYEKLGIPYRVVLLCSAELGKVSSKTYDIEGWMPSQNTYREIVSCSNDIDYQARRLSIRFRDKTSEQTRLVHTLNSTLVATERTIVAILENYQTSNGTIKVPTALQEYMNGLKEIQPVPR